ncbi:hypothetical protein PISMIDRAFT_203585 [Pisolithus microcarpus 441]|uniref:Uncharacterized protein n=1 Tax=Pisolithus microcarpus 441 TaxID=765257 RepID=A0A0C9ZMV7_9AGAM|nr:hypothetical protein BKA83DRAFT_203585 [Pisolithus microcarpus]KIK27249.1 hypothetical protein PISMIDRAFT_203585 [Pisolithus microcarpus 441]
MWRWTTTRGGIFWEPPRHPQLTATHTPCCKGKHRQMRGRRVRVLRRTELPHRTPPQRFLDPRTRLRSNLSFYRTLVSQFHSAMVAPCAREPRQIYHGHAQLLSLVDGVAISLRIMQFPNGIVIAPEAAVCSRISPRTGRI